MQPLGVDLYSFDSDVKRGVRFAMPTPEVGVFEHGASRGLMGFLQGDSYSLESKKGMGMATPPPAASCNSTCFANDYNPDELMWALSCSEGPDPKSNATLGKGPAEHDHFEESHIPPDVSTDEFFELLPTTMRMRLPFGTSPHEIGSTLLSFFEASTASVLKVRPQKFKVTAEVFADSGVSLIKARAYNEYDGNYALEFQRARGCTLLFTRVYQQAIKFFGKKYEIISKPISSMMGEKVFDNLLPPVSLNASAGEFIVPPPPPLLSKDTESNDGALNIAPLLSMLELEECPKLQAEAMWSLAGLARDQPSALEVGMEALTSAIRSLLTSSLPEDPEAAYALANTLLHLTRDVEACLKFARGGILELLADKVMSKAHTCLPVLMKMAQAIAEASKNVCHDDTIVTQKKHLMEQLDSGVAFTDAGIRGSLHQAWKCLDMKFPLELVF